MSQSDTKIDNKKYIKEKRRKEFAAALGFLSLNLIGFLVITFLPIFATFFLSFTEWDGQSKASKPKIGIVATTDQPQDKSIAYPKNAKVVFTFPKKDYLNKDVTVPFIVQQDIVLSTKRSTLVPFLDIQSFKEWDFVKNDQGQILNVPDAETLKKINQKYKLRLTVNDFKYIRPNRVYFNRKNILQLKPRIVTPVSNISRELMINMNNGGKEIGAVLLNTKKQAFIPKGTIILADLSIKVVNSIETQTMVFPLNQLTRKKILIKKGKDISRQLDLEALTPGMIVSDKVDKVARFFRFVGFPKGLKISVKYILKQGNDGIKWVGLKNYYGIIFQDTRFMDYLLNTLFFLIEIPIGMAVALIIALAMNQPLKGIVAFRVMYFLPYISNIVAVAIVWQWVLQSDYGLINQTLRLIGIANPPHWFSNEMWAKIAIVIVDVWKGAGYTMMLYLAGLQAIPHYLYEAAEIDGASNFQQFWSVTWPLLGPTNFFIIIMGIIGGFQAFGTQYVLTGGGPNGSTTTIVYYIYNNAFKWSKMGYATAMSVVLFIFVMIITVINWKVSESNVEY